MKTKTRFITLSLATVFVVVLVLAARAADMPTLDQIVSNAMQASTSPKSYQAKVTQTIWTESARTSAQVEGTGLPSILTSGTASFMVVYIPGEKLSTQDIDLEKTTATESTEGAQNDLEMGDQSGKNVRVTVDINTFLQQLDAANQVVVEPELIDGREIFKISADYDGGTKCTLWIDAENWYVSEVIVDLLGATFSQITFTHRYFDGFWLPSGIVMYLPSDGSEIIQELDYFFPDE